jgi:hypothetical protein
MTKETNEERRLRWKNGLDGVELPDDISSIIREAFRQYKGDLTVFESAVGSLYLGLFLGWRPLMIIHNPKTIKRYEKILKINFREVMSEASPLADRSYGYRAAKTLNNYWDVVRGTVPVPQRHEVGLDDLPLLPVD